MAKISVLKSAVCLCKDAMITPFIWGHRGVGKSSLVRQIAAERDWGFIDMRASQLEASDIRGLPDKGEDGRTRYLPPADLPVGDLKPAEIAKQVKTPADWGDLQAVRIYEEQLAKFQNRFEHGILFLDEVNRAQDDVLQAVFQLVLDRRVGQYTLPPGWAVVAAGNYMEGYSVSGFSDPAFINRFCHMDLSTGETTLEEWVSFMSTAHGAIASDVIEYASQNTKHLDGEIKGDRGFSVQPSRRSWEMVVRVQAALAAAPKDRYGSDVALEVYSGLVGRELALTFSKYSCPVKPIQLLNEGVKAHSAKLSKLDRNQFTGLMWGLVSFCKNRLDDDKVATVCLDFAEHMLKSVAEKDIVVAFIRALIGGDGKNAATLAVVSNVKLAQMMGQMNKDPKLFVNRLNSRPELQAALAKAAWGT